MKKKIAIAFMSVWCLSPLYADFTYSYSLSSKEGTVTGYSGTDQRVVIPSSFRVAEEYVDEEDGETHTRYHTIAVTGIGVSVFKNKTFITSVTFPEGLKSIGSGAFSGCTGLKTFDPPSSLETLGSGVLADCTSLETLVIDGNGLNVGGNMFNGCSKLRSVVYGEGVASISGGSIGNMGGRYFSFSGCTNLESIVVLSTKVRTVPRCFCSQPSLKTLSFAGVITNIGQNAFTDCTGLTTIDATLKPVSIAADAFAGCTNLDTPIDFSDCTFLGARAFKNCRSLAREISLPKLTTVSDSSFNGCTALTGASLKGVSFIGGSAFYGCSSLSYVSFSKGLKSIKDSAFKGCSSISSVLFPEGLIDIGSSAFSGCSGLTSVLTPESLASLGHSAFSDCTSLKEAEIHGTGLDLTGSHSLFSECVGLRRAVFGDGVTALPDSSNYYTSFWGCTALEEVSVGSGVTKVPIYFLYSYSTNKQPRPGKVSFAGNITNAGFRSLCCSALTNLTIHLSRCTVDTEAFRGCSGVTSESVDFSEIVGSIGSEAFRLCTNITGGVDLSNCTSIGSSAFEGCKNIDAVTFGEGLVNIGSSAFSGCTNASSFAFASTPPSVGSSPFGNVKTGARGEYPGRYADEWISEIDVNGKWNGLVMFEVFPLRRIENVRARSIPGTQKVKVFYDLNVDDGKKYDIGLSFGRGAGGGGVSVSPSALTGDLGQGVIPGKNKVIEWDSGADVTESALSNLVAQIEATRPDETLEGASDEFDIKLRGERFGVEDVFCDYCSGAYGTAYGRHATFLSGVKLPVEFTIRLKSRTNVIRGVRVNGGVVGEYEITSDNRFTADVGRFSPGAKMEVQVVFEDVGGKIVYSPPFRVNLDVAPVPDGAGEMFVLDMQYGTIRYAGESFDSVPFFDDADDLLWFFGREVPFTFMPSFRSARWIDSSSGEYRIANDFGIVRKLKSKRKKLYDLLKVKPLLRFGEVDINGEVGGSVTMTYNPELRCWQDAKGSFRAKFNGKAAMSTRIPQTLWLVKVEGGIKVAAVVDVRIDRETGLYEGTIDLSPLISGYGSLMAGFPYVNATGTVGGDLDYAADLHGPTLTTSRFGGMIWGEFYWRVFGWGNYDDDDRARIWRSYDFLTGKHSSGSSGNVEEASAEAEAVRSFSADIVDGNAATVIAATGVTSTVTMNAPALAMSNDGTFRTWIRNTASGREVVFTGKSAWNNTAGESIWQDNTPDFAPSIGVSSNGTVVIAWMNASRPFGNVTDFATVMKSMEIAVAVRDSASGKWSAKNLTSDYVADMSPRLVSAADGTAMVVWTRCPAGTCFNAVELPMQLWGARYADGGWSKPVCIDADVGVVLGFDLFYDGTVATVVCVNDADGDFATPGDFAVQAASWRNGMWGSPTALATGLANAGSPAVGLDADGTALAIWSENGTLRERPADGSGLAADAVVLAGDGTEIPEDAQPVRGADGVVALVWSKQMEDGLSTCPVVMPRNPATGSWGGPIAVAATPGRQARSVIGVCAANGDLRLAWESVVVSTNISGSVVDRDSKIFETEVAASPDPAVLAEDWSFGVDDVIHGSETPVVVKVRNLGLESSENVAVKMFVRDGAGAETELPGVFGETVIPDLPGGAVVTVTNLWVSNDSLADLTFRAEVILSDGAADSDKDNNGSEWRPGVPDLWLENARSVVETADIRLLTVTIRNFGLAPTAEGTKVSFRRGTPDGTEIGADEIGVVIPGEINGYDAGISWDMKGVAFTGAWETVYVVIDSGDAERDAARAVPIRVMTARDTDGDGLLDAEEGRLGTDPSNADTNGDGVSDYNHIYTFFTSPVVSVPSTRTTPVPVPCQWLDNYSAMLSAHDGDYESFANANARNGRPVWQCYVTGIDPTDESSVFQARIGIVDGEPVVTWEPDTPELRATRVYRTLGKKTLMDQEWIDVTDQDRSEYNFFKVTVDLR